MKMLYKKLRWGQVTLGGLLGGILLVAGTLGVGGADAESTPGKAPKAPVAKEAAPPKEVKDRIELQVKFDKAEYRPGEMVVCQVELVNRYNAPMLVAQPVSVKQVRHSNLHFRLMRKGDEQIYRRVPVVIREPALVADVLAPRFESLQPGAGLLEKFAFVNLTRAEGEYVLYAEYESVSARDKGNGDTADAKKETQKSGVPVEFTVKGKRLWQRDGNDLLTREEAIRVARAKCGGEVTGARATLVETESSLLDWWVTLDRAAGGRAGYYVSPYGGFVRSQAPSLAVEPEEALKTLMDERTRQFQELQSDRKSAPLKSFAQPGQPAGTPDAGAPGPAEGVAPGAPELSVPVEGGVPAGGPAPAGVSAPVAGGAGGGK
ncbi:MAG TPA: hypothetical protein PLA90_01965 [Candidatus Sumerlaeota bacterium]|nr:hypothetical protein [Candidatus Sumerlaeota bacterium]